MTIAGDGGIRVPAPRCDPRPYGLDTVMELDERPDNRWMKGLEFDREICAPPSIVSNQCPPLPEDMQQTKTTERGFFTGFSDPFVVYKGYDCSTGGAPVEDAWDHAQALLDQTWLTGLELALWTGEDQDGNTFRMSLAGEATDLTPMGGAVDLTLGLALLEQAIAADSPCWPIVHANPVLGPIMASRALLTHAGPILRTSSGSRVVLGAGYPVTGPGGDSAGTNEAWLFISGGVRVTTGPMFFTPERGDLAGATDRAANNVDVFAEKGFAIELGCSVFAILVQVTKE